MTTKRARKGASTSLASPTLKLATVTPIREKSPRLSAQSRACVAVLKKLLKEAERGEMAGLVFISVYGSDNRYELDMNYVGIAEENKVFTLGMVAALSHQLAEEL